ncbi:NB-ARC domain-containing protein [Mycobacterium sp. 1164966.3]|uniref:ATP-binding protein n=1 Tax=Mycobacterium sp. 1164966.3 TaxID=1856861 RepID=UPI00352FC126
MVTLTGVGGVGKTRLALEVATRLADEFPDGVWIFELAAVTDPAAVPDAVSSVLGITQQPDKTVSDSVAAALEGRVRLLVIDNCEHVLDAAADLIEAILTHSATVTVLATSREALRITDEHSWPVPSLEVDAGTDSAAVSLFVERSQAVSPRFSLGNADEATAVVDICNQLDGIPLAIELAASRMASMTPREMRNRLSQRFRLLVGSRRGLERHQTLRQAVAWSYDLLEENEKTLLDYCSVFAGGFDLQSACAISGSDDDLAVLDQLDALVRKSLVVADRLSGKTRFSMLETIRQFSEEQLVAQGAATEVRAAHARYFAGKVVEVFAVWDSPRQRQAYDWFTVELANMRTAFRWAADHNDLDVAISVATHAMVLGLMIENYEPIAWADELIERARITDHSQLASLYMMAAAYWMVGRVEEAVRYSEAGQRLLLAGSRASPPGFESWLGGVHNFTGEPERVVEWCRGLLARIADPYALTTTGLVVAYMRAGAHAEAIAVANHLIEKINTIANPWAVSYALMIYGMACCDADPTRARDALRRGLAIAQESGNRYNVSHLANVLGRLEARHGDPVAALDNLALAIRNYHDSGNTIVVKVPLAALVALLDKIGRYEPAARIAGSASNPVTQAWIPEINAAIAHLREVLGASNYESLACSGEAMTTAAMAAYAYDQIDQARAELKTDSQ